MSQTLTVTEAKARLSELVAAVETTHDQIDITRNGEPAAALVSYAELSALRETIAVLSDAQVRADLAESDEDIRLGRTVAADALQEALLHRRAELQ